MCYTEQPIFGRGKSCEYIHINFWPINSNFYKSHLLSVSYPQQNSLLSRKAIKNYSLEFTKGQRKLSLNRSMCLLYI